MILTSSGKLISQKAYSDYLNQSAEVNILGGITSGGLPVILTKEELSRESAQAKIHFESAVEHGIIKLKY